MSTAATNLHNQCRHLIGSVVSIKGRLVIDRNANFCVANVTAAQLQGGLVGNSVSSVIGSQVVGDPILVSGNLLSEGTITTFRDYILDGGSLSGGFCLGDTNSNIRLCGNLNPQIPNTYTIGCFSKVHSTNISVAVLQTKTTGFLTVDSDIIIDDQSTIGSKVSPFSAIHSNVIVFKKDADGNNVPRLIPLNGTIIDLNADLAPKIDKQFSLGRTGAQFQTFETSNLTSDCVDAQKTTTTVLSSNSLVVTTGNVQNDMFIGGDLTIMGTLQNKDIADVENIELGNIKTTQLCIREKIDACNPSQPFDICVDGQIKANAVQVNTMLSVTGNLSFANIEGPEFMVNKGNANGYLELDDNAIVPINRFPGNVMILQGCWDAGNNIPDLGNLGNVRDGDYYIVSNTGKTVLSGISEWDSGDTLFYGKGDFHRIDNNDKVTSLNGLTGNFTFATADLPEGNTNEYFTDERVENNDLVKKAIKHASTLPAYAIYGSTETFPNETRLADITYPMANGVSQILTINPLMPSVYPNGNPLSQHRGWYFLDPAYFSQMTANNVITIFSNCTAEITLNLNMKYNVTTIGNIRTEYRFLKNGTPLVNELGNDAFVSTIVVNSKAYDIVGNTSFGFFATKPLKNLYRTPKLHHFEQFVAIMDFDAGDKLSFEITPFFDNGGGTMRIRRLEAILQRLSV